MALLAVLLAASACAFAGSGPSGAPSSSAASGEATTLPGGTTTSSASPPTAPAASQETPAASQGTAAASPRPMPECDYLDEPVLGDPGSDWATLVLDTVFTLPADFAPAKLVSTRRAGLNGGYQVSRVIVDDLKAMADAAQADGVPLAVQSAYRSYAYQVTTYQGWVDRSSEEEARTVSARPGHSEHQLGTALDLRSADDATPPWQLDDFAATDTGAWLEQHAWEYGFVMSYPKGRKKQTCYAYEPWHYRYVGRDVAAAIHESGQVPRRYLWETYWADH
jgi:D-alanyl-D-alanine carboxypeptidase